MRNTVNAFPLPAVPFEARSRTVGFGSAFDWYRQGWAIFAASPGRWLAATFCILLAYFLLTRLPTVGWPLAQSLTPLLVANFLLGCHKVASDAQPAGMARLRNRSFRALAILGGLFLLGVTVVGHLLRLMLGGAARLSVSSGRLLAALPPFGDWMVIGVVGGLLLLPLLMAFCFAPALIVFNRLPAAAALQASFQACLKNIGALLVAGAILLGLVFVALLPVGLGVLIFAPVLAGSVYAAYRDIFLAT